MSQENHEHRHHFQHHKLEEEKQNLTPYEKAMKEEKKHKRMEHLGQLGAVAAGTFALVLYIHIFYSLHFNLNACRSSQFILLIQCINGVVNSQFLEFVGNRQTRTLLIA